MEAPGQVRAPSCRETTLLGSFGSSKRTCVLRPTLVFTAQNKRDDKAGPIGVLVANAAPWFFARRKTPTSAVKRSVSHFCGPALRRAVRQRQQRVWNTVFARTHTAVELVLVQNSATWDWLSWLSSRLVGGDRFRTRRATKDSGGKSLQYSSKRS